MQGDLRSRQVAVPGILGGLGPLAHIEFERRLIQENVRRGARSDQDHPTWVLISASDTPDRTRSLAGEVSSSVPGLTRAALLLAHAGVDFIVVTCNTAHAYHGVIAPALPVPWIHLQHVTGQAILEAHPAKKRIGIMETSGTGGAKLYSESLEELGLEPISIYDRNPALQRTVMNAIYHPDWGIKSTGIWISHEAIEALHAGMQWLAEAGAEIVIAGCTELSVGFDRMNGLPLPWIDPLDVAASVTLDLAFGIRPLSDHFLFPAEAADIAHA